MSDKRDMTHTESFDHLVTKLYFLRERAGDTKIQADDTSISDEPHSSLHDELDLLIPQVLALTNRLESLQNGLAKWHSDHKHDGIPTDLDNQMDQFRFELAKLTGFPELPIED